MIKTVFAATDGSEPAERAIAAAAEIAAGVGARMVIGHVAEEANLTAEMLRMAEVEHLIDKPTVEQRSITNAPSWMLDSLRDISTPGARRQVVNKLGEEALARAASIAGDAGAKKVETALLDGDASPALLEAAAKAGADLIAVGSRGVGGLQELVFGGVSNKIVHEAKCPCLVVK